MTTIYVSDNFVRVLNSSGTFDYTYVYHNGQQVAQVKPSGTKEFIHGDHIGSSSVVTDESGNVIENTTYEPFGSIVSGGDATRFDYENKEYDSDLGTYDFHFRQYKPEWGLFTQPDTLIQNVYDPQSLNRYMFERGNPYGRIDPDGHNALYVGAATVGFILGVLYYESRHPMTDTEVVDASYSELANRAAARFGHGLIGSVAAVGTVALSTRGGSFVRSTLLAAVGKAAIGAAEYAAHQNLEGEPLDFGDAIAAGTINTLDPIKIKGTYGIKNIFTKNNWKYFGNQIAGYLGSLILDAGKSGVNKLYESNNAGQMSIKVRSIYKSKSSKRSYLVETDGEGNEKVYSGGIRNINGEKVFIGVRPVKR